MDRARQWIHFICQNDLDSRCAVEFELNTIFAAIQMNFIMMRFIASLVLVIGQVGVKAQMLRPRALSLQKIATYTPRKCATSDGRSNVVDPANI